jgi:2-iminobutanoate/2-iminopropanoate deaminase
MQKTIFNPPTVHTPVSDYSHACKIDGGKMLFVAGQVPVDISGNLVGQGDLRVQLKQVLENMKLVLEAGGATFGNIVQTMTFLRDSEDVVERFRAIRKELFPRYFPDSVYPPNTLLVVPSLYSKDVLVEYQALAVID